MRSRAPQVSCLGQSLLSLCNSKSSSWKNLGTRLSLIPFYSEIISLLLLRQFNLWSSWRWLNCVLSLHVNPFLDWTLSQSSLLFSSYKSFIHQINQSRDNMVSVSSWNFPQKDHFLQVCFSDSIRLETYFNIYFLSSSLSSSFIFSTWNHFAHIFLLITKWPTFVSSTIMSTKFVSPWLDFQADLKPAEVESKFSRFLH